MKFFMLTGADRFRISEWQHEKFLPQATLYFSFLEWIIRMGQSNGTEFWPKERSKEKEGKTLSPLAPLTPLGLPPFIVNRVPRFTSRLLLIFFLFSLNRY